MWIGTGNGISRVQIVNGKYYIVNYTIKDGLICNDTNIHAILKLDNGNILIGTPKGYQTIIPQEILRAMNIDIVERQGYEGDDILGTLSVFGEKQGLDVTILSGDRDTFQLATDKVTIRIPRTKMGKTEVEDFNKAKVKEIYNLEPKQLIEVKGLSRIGTLG